MHGSVCTHACLRVPCVYLIISRWLAVVKVRQQGLQLTKLQLAALVRVVLRELILDVRLRTALKRGARRLGVNLSPVGQNKNTKQPWNRVVHVQANSACCVYARVSHLVRDVVLPHLDRHLKLIFADVAVDLVITFGTELEGRSYQMSQQGQQQRVSIRRNVVSCTCALVLARLTKTQRSDPARVHAKTCCQPR